MSVVRPFKVEETAPTRGISSTRLRAVRHLKFFHGPDESLTVVEFETHPMAKVLNIIFSALSALRVCIADSSTRITQSSLYQRLQLSEMGGAPLLGERRTAVEALFLETLAALSNEAPEELARAVG